MNKHKKSCMRAMRDKLNRNTEYIYVGKSEPRSRNKRPIKPEPKILNAFIAKEPETRNVEAAIDQTDSHTELLVEYSINGAKSGLREVQKSGHGVQQLFPLFKPSDDITSATRIPTLKIIDNPGTEELIKEVDTGCISRVLQKLYLARRSLNPVIDEIINNASKFSSTDVRHGCEPVCTLTQRHIAGAINAGKIFQEVTNELHKKRNSGTVIVGETFRFPSSHTIVNIAFVPENQSAVDINRIYIDKELVLQLIDLYEMLGRTIEQIKKCQKQQQMELSRSLEAGINKTMRDLDNIIPVTASRSNTIRTSSRRLSTLDNPVVTKIMPSTEEVFRNISSTGFQPVPSSTPKKSKSIKNIAKAKQRLLDCLAELADIRDYLLENNEDDMDLMNHLILTKNTPDEDCCSKKGIPHLHVNLNGIPVILLIHKKAVDYMIENELFMPEDIQITIQELKEGEPTAETQVVISPTMEGKSNHSMNNLYESSTSKGLVITLAKEGESQNVEIAEVDKKHGTSRVLSSVNFGPDNEITEVEAAEGMTPEIIVEDEDVSAPKKALSSVVFVPTDDTPSLNKISSSVFRIPQPQSTASLHEVAVQKSFKSCTCKKMVSCKCPINPPLNKKKQDICKEKCVETVPCTNQACQTCEEIREYYQTDDLSTKPCAGHEVTERQRNLSQIGSKPSLRSGSLTKFDGSKSSLHFEDDPQADIFPSQSRSAGSLINDETIYNTPRNSTISGMLSKSRSSLKKSSSMIKTLGRVSEKAINTDSPGRLPSRHLSSVGSVVGGTKHRRSHSGSRMSRSQLTLSGSEVDVPYSVSRGSMPDIARNRVCSSLEFDVNMVHSTLRVNGISHPNQYVKKRLEALGTDNIIRACRPAKCCRKTILNEKSKLEIPYPASLRSLPLNESDVRVITETINMIEPKTGTHSKTHTYHARLEYYARVNSDLDSRSDFPWVIPTYEIMYFEVQGNPKLKDVSSRQSSSLSNSNRDRHSERFPSFLWPLPETNVRHANFGKKDDNKKTVGVNATNSKRHDTYSYLMSTSSPQRSSRDSKMSTQSWAPYNPSYSSLPRGSMQRTPSQTQGSFKDTSVDAKLTTTRSKSETAGIQSDIGTQPPARIDESIYSRSIDIPYETSTASLPIREVGSVDRIPQKDTSPPYNPEIDNSPLSPQNAAKHMRMLSLVGKSCECNIPQNFVSCACGTLPGAPVQSKFAVAVKTKDQACDCDLMENPTSCACTNTVPIAQKDQGTIPAEISTSEDTAASYKTADSGSQYSAPWSMMADNSVQSASVHLVDKDIPSTETEQEESRSEEEDQDQNSLLETIAEEETAAVDHALECAKCCKDKGKKEPEEISGADYKDNSTHTDSIKESTEDLPKQDTQTSERLRKTQVDLKLGLSEPSSMVECNCPQLLELISCLCDPNEEQFIGKTVQTYSVYPMQSVSGRLASRLSGLSGRRSTIRDTARARCCQCPDLSEFRPCYCTSSALLGPSGSSVHAIESEFEEPYIDDLAIQTSVPELAQASTNTLGPPSQHTIPRTSRSTLIPGSRARMSSIVSSASRRGSKLPRSQSRISYQPSFYESSASLGPRSSMHLDPMPSMVTPSRVSFRPSGSSISFRPESSTLLEQVPSVVMPNGTSRSRLSFSRPRILESTRSQTEQDAYTQSLAELTYVPSIMASRGTFREPSYLSTHSLPDDTIYDQEYEEETDEEDEDYPDMLERASASRTSAFRNCDCPLDLRSCDCHDLYFNTKIIYAKDKKRKDDSILDIVNNLSGSDENKQTPSFKALLSELDDKDKNKRSYATYPVFEQRLLNKKPLFFIPEARFSALYGTVVNIEPAILICNKMNEKNKKRKRGREQEWILPLSFKRSKTCLLSSGPGEVNKKNHKTSSTLQQDKMYIAQVMLPEQAPLDDKFNSVTLTSVSEDKIGSFTQTIEKIDETKAKRISIAVSVENKASSEGSEEKSKSGDAYSSSKEIQTPRRTIKNRGAGTKIERAVGVDKSDAQIPQSNTTVKSFGQTPEEMLLVYQTTGDDLCDMNIRCLAPACPGNQEEPDTIQQDSTSSEESAAMKTASSGKNTSTSNLTESTLPKSTSTKCSIGSKKSKETTTSEKNINFLVTLGDKEASERTITTLSPAKVGGKHNPNCRCPLLFEQPGIRKQTTSSDSTEILQEQSNILQPVASPEEEDESNMSESAPQTCYALTKVNTLEDGTKDFEILETSASPPGRYIVTEKDILILLGKQPTSNNS